MSTATLPLTSATATSCLVSRSTAKPCSDIKQPSLTFKSPPFPSTRRISSCRVAPVSVDKDEKGESVSGSQEVEQAGARIGARVRVKAPVKVYHVPRVPEMELTGMEGLMKQYIGVWKGKPISANFPYKVEFVAEIEGRGPVKFFAHLREDEFEYLD